MAHEGAHVAHHETSPWGLPVGLVPLVLSLAAVAYFGWGWSLVGLILAGIALVLLVIGAQKQHDYGGYDSPDDLKGGVSFNVFSFLMLSLPVAILDGKVNGWNGYYEVNYDRYPEPYLYRVLPVSPWVGKHFLRKHRPRKSQQR